MWRSLGPWPPATPSSWPTNQPASSTSPGVQILDLLRKQAVAGKTVLVVTHNREISRVADRVIELSSGTIVGDGPPAGGRADISDLRW